MTPGRSDAFWPNQGLDLMNAANNQSVQHTAGEKAENTPRLGWLVC